MSGKLKHQLAGKRFGKWTVIKYAGNGRWKSKCDCGTEDDVLCWNLVSGHTVRCDKCRMAWLTKHGQAGYPYKFPAKPTYHTWQGMKKRCLDKKNVAYKHYGGRGITVCERWKSDFRNFLADMGEKPPGKTLDRIDNNGNYEPSNCRWSTWLEQAQNKRNVKIITCKGEKVSISEAARRINRNSGHLYVLLRDQGWPDIDVSILPRDNPKRFLIQHLSKQ